MRPCLFILYLLLNNLFSQAQILNAGFENRSLETITKPSDWLIENTSHQKFSLDSSHYFSGKSSLKISGSETEDSDYLAFYQTISTNFNSLKIIELKAKINTNNLSGTAALLIKSLDDKGEKIAFQNSEMQDLIIKQTTDWNTYKLTIKVNPSVKKLVIGGYASGNGIAWFDDFELIELDEKPYQKFNSVANELKNIIKQNSVYTEYLNWKNIDETIPTLFTSLASDNYHEIISNYFISELRKAGDNHSFYQTKKATETYATKNTNTAKPIAKLIDKHIGYIKVPGFSTTNPTIAQHFADTIQNLIRELDTKHQIDAWIVDLRNNTGGNMHPMIAGLGPLLQEGALGYFIKNDEQYKTQNRWFYENGNAGNGENINLVSIQNPYKIKNNSKIAILININTSSSGEMTAISFTGQKNVKLFGTHSGGYTTGNVTYNLTNGASLVLATSLVANRNKEKFLNGINPDYPIIIKNKDKDDILLGAVNWILNK